MGTNNAMVTVCQFYVTFVWFVLVPIQWSVFSEGEASRVCVWGQAKAEALRSTV